MARKFLLFIVICISLVALLCRDAKAFPVSSSNIGLKLGSVIVDSTWVGVANAELKPTFIQATIIPYETIVYCQNNGGNTGGVGVPFYTTEAVTGVDSLTPNDQATKNGKYNSEIVFENADILAAIQNLNPVEVCSKNNWTPTGELKVVSLDVHVQAFADVSGICPEFPADQTNTNTISYDDTCFLEDRTEEEVVHVKLFCTLNGTIYDCTEKDHWEWSKRDQSYPYNW